MARDFTAASSHTVNYGDIGDLGTNKITLACWMYPDSFATSYGLINKRSAHNSANAYSMGVGYTSTNRWELQLGNAANTAVGANYYATRSEATSQWYHVCMTYDGSLSAGSRCAIYIDGVSKTVTAGTDANVTPGNAASDLVLGRVNNSGSFYFDGRMAEPAIWDDALSADEVAALAKRYAPDRIRPANLAFYDNLIRDLRDIVTGTVPSSSTAVIDHPPVIRRRRAQILVPMVAGGGGPAEGSGTGTAATGGEGEGYAEHSGSGTGTAASSGAGVGYAAHSGSGTGTAASGGAGEGEAPTGAAEGSGVGTAASGGAGEGYGLHYGSGTGTATTGGAGDGDNGEAVATRIGGGGSNVGRRRRYEDLLWQRQLEETRRKELEAKETPLTKPKAPKRAPSKPAPSPVLPVAEIAKSLESPAKVAKINPVQSPRLDPVEATDEDEFVMVLVQLLLAA